MIREVESFDRGRMGSKEKAGGTGMNYEDSEKWHERV